MTPEELENLVKRGDGMAIANALQSLSESERRKLSKTASTLLREIERFQRVSWDTTDDSRFKVSAVMRRILGARFHRVALHKKKYAAELAVMGLCPISVTKRVHASHYHHRDKTPDDFIKVLSDRCPPWIDNWIAERLKGEWPTIDWHVFRTLQKDRVCQKPTSDDYYRFMATSLNGWSAFVGRRKRLLSKILAEETDLLEDIWKLFEVDTIAFAYDWGDEKKREHESWPTALCTLAKQGLIDRQRLLDSSLRGLTTGLKQNLLSGFARFHERLQPTAAEIVARQSIYLDLLSVKVNQVVSFALKMLKKVDQAKRLDDAAFASSSKFVFDIPTKGSAKTTISLLKKVAKRSPQLQQQIAEVLVDAVLAHPASDVVEAAVELIGALRDALEPSTVEALQDALPDLPATVQPLVREILGDAGADAPPAEEVGASFAELKPAALEVPKKWRVLAGVDAAIAAIESGDFPEPCQFSLFNVPVLSGVEAIEPIASVDELIDAIAHAIEQIDCASELERILDGISRFCEQRPDDFERRTAPLVKRMTGARLSETSRGIVTTWGMPQEIDKLLGTWLCGDPEALRPPHGWLDLDYHRETNILAFLALRLQRLRERVQDRTAAPLLAFPTHEGGWLDPRVLITRWAEMEASGVEFDEVEVIQAILRLAPDGRPEALAASAGLQNQSARALRWALGSDEGPTRKDLRNGDLWLAAGRARKCGGQLSELKSWKYDTPGPDGIEPATYTLNFDFIQHDDQGWSTTYNYTQVEVQQQPKLGKKSITATRPTVLLHQHIAMGAVSPYAVSVPWALRWIRSVWPQDTDPFLAVGIGSLACRIDDTSSSWEPHFPYIEPLLDVDRPWSKVACWAACLGLAGRDQDVRLLALDAIIEAIADGRLHGEPLGQALTEFAKPNYLKLNRLCPTLAEVARISSLHAWVVAEALQIFLGSYEKLPRNAHHLLALLQELLLQSGCELDPQAQRVLSQVSGGGKTAKLAKALLKLTASESPAADEVRLQILKARMDRAQRWHVAK